MLKLHTAAQQDFYLWGLLTGAAGHKVCWEINKFLHLHLTRQEDICLEREPEAADLYFSYYFYEDELEAVFYELIRNKVNGEIYHRELKNFDYLLMVKGEIDFFDPDRFSGALRKAPSVQSAMKIDLAKLKQLTHLILE